MKRQEVIADRLGVSQRLVAYALNGNGRMREATRQRIRREAARLGYRPNRTTRAPVLPPLVNVGAYARTLHISTCRSSGGPALRQPRSGRSSPAGLRRFRWHSLAGLLALALALGAQGATQTFVLEELLGLDWECELVTWPFTALAGACHPKSLRLEGPDGERPVQLLDVETWPDTAFVKQATVATIVDLPAGQRHEYVLHYGVEPLAQTDPAKGLTVTPTADGAEIGTGRLGLRVRLGGGAGPAPGPIAGMRREEGPWFGDSRLYGDAGVAGWRGEMEGAGPVLARCRWRYDYSNGTVMVLQMDLPAGSNVATWDMRVVSRENPDFEALLRGPGFQFGEAPAAKTEPTFGWLFDLAAGLDDLRVLAIQEHGRNRWGGADDKRPLVDPSAEPPGVLINLAAWDGWWDQEVQGAIHLYSAAAEPQLSVVAIDSGTWVEPLAPGTLASYGNPRMRHQWVPLERDAQGRVYLRFRAAVGRRRWVLAPAPPVAEAGDGVPGRRLRPLDDVRAMVLHWEGDEGTHPRLFFSQADLEARRERGIEPEQLAELKESGKHSIGTPSRRDPPALTAWLLTGDPKIAEDLFIVKRLDTFLARFGAMDTMRDAAQVVCFYDVLIDSPLVTPERRRLFQARLAYLTYHLASAENWSMERGYASGNLNMSVAHVMNLGLMAATIPQHPMAEEWSQSALALMEKWLTHNVGPDGEFLGNGESLGNYAFVSVSMMMVYAIAADRAGFADFADDPRLRKLMLHLAKIFTPTDPRFKGRIGTPPVGRGPSHTGPGLSGLMARFTAAVDPAYSAGQQWHWLRVGQSTGYVSDRMAGLEKVYMDSTLPAVNPAWGSETISTYGAVLRHGTDEPSPWWAFFLIQGRDRLVYESECGAFASIYAHGVPVSERFGLHGYEQRENIFISRVLPAYDANDPTIRRKQWSITGPMDVTHAAFLARQDYLVASLSMQKWDSPCGRFWDKIPAWAPPPGDAKLPVHWNRQVLFVRDDNPAGVNYFVFRDTVSGGQPTVWQMWTLSDRLVTPEQASDRSACLADAPGKALVDARRIAGDRFVALGPYGVDVDYYIAAPVDTPRYTLRHGGKYYHYYDQYMDLLRLDRTDDGAYFVALCPRPVDRPTPTFATEGAGHIIRVSGPWGEDLVFLAGAPTTAGSGGIEFTGTAGSLQRRGGETVLCLGAAGTIAIDGGWSLQADTACSLRAGRIELPRGHAGATVSCRAPGGGWVEQRVDPGVPSVALDGVR